MYQDVHFTPFSMVPPGVLPNRNTLSELRIANRYASPAHVINYPKKGRATPAAIYARTGQEYLQDKWNWPLANNVLVTFPAQRVDKGTWTALAQFARGTSNQQRQSITNTAIAGYAPNQGIYTGFQEGF